MAAALSTPRLIREFIGNMVKQEIGEVELGAEESKKVRE